MGDFVFPALGAAGARYQSRENLVTAINAALDSLAASLVEGVNVIGQWDASSGAFPTARPDSSAIQQGDAWAVTDGGTVDGVTFAALDWLVAISGGATYAGNWIRLAYSAPLAAVGSASVTPTGGTGATLADLLGGVEPIPALNVEAATSFILSLAGLGAGVDLRRWRLRNQSDGSLLLQVGNDDLTRFQAALIVTRRNDFDIGDGDGTQTDDPSRYLSTNAGGATSAARAVNIISAVCDRFAVSEKQGTAANMTTLRGVELGNRIEPDLAAETLLLGRDLWRGAGYLETTALSPRPLRIGLGAGWYGGFIQIDKGGRIGFGVATPERKIHLRDEYASTVVRVEAPNNASADIEFQDSVTVTRPSVRGVGDGLALATGGSNRLTVSSAGAVAVNGGASLVRLLRATASLDFGSIAAQSGATLTVAVTGAQTGDHVSVSANTGSSVLTLLGYVSATNTVTVRCFNISAGAVDPAAFTVSVEVRGYA